MGAHPAVMKNLLNACKNIKYLSLEYCSLGDLGSAVIWDLLKQNPSLEHLYLGETELTDQDANIIANALKSNTNLRVLSLVGNAHMNITELGREALSRVLFNTSSLHGIANSNHTCVLQTVSGGEEPTQYETLLNILNRKGCPNDNRKWKVLSVLYSTKGKGICNEFKTYQNLRLIPEILAYIVDSSGSSFGDTQSTEEMREEEPIAGESCTMLQVDDDDLSIESDDSYDGYDSEMEDLDEAFEEEEVDKAYVNFDQSFMNPSLLDGRVKLTMVYQVLKLWGLPLLDKGPTVPGPATEEVLPEAKPKSKVRRVTSVKCYNPCSKPKKEKRQRLVVSQRELKSLLD